MTKSRLLPISYTHGPFSVYKALEMGEAAAESDYNFCHVHIAFLPAFLTLIPPPLPLRKYAESVAA